MNYHGFIYDTQTHIDPYICPCIIKYNILSDDAQFQSDLFTHEKLSLHGDNEKKKTGHDEMTLSFEESSVGLPLHLSVSKKIRNEIDVKLKKLTTFFSGKLQAIFSAIIH